MLKLVAAFLIVGGLILYLLVRDDLGAETPQLQKSVTVSPEAVEPEAKTEERYIEPIEVKEAAVVATVKKQSAETPKPTNTRKEEEEKADLVEMNEEMEAIEADERSEDYYEGNEEVRREDLIGGADVEWEAPREPAKEAGKFGMPPPIH